MPHYSPTLIPAATMLAAVTVYDLVPHSWHRLVVVFGAPVVLAIMFWPAPPIDSTTSLLDTFEDRLDDE